MKDWPSTYVGNCFIIFNRDAIALLCTNLSSTKPGEKLHVYSISYLSMMGGNVVGYSPGVRKGVQKKNKQEVVGTYACR